MAICLTGRFSVVVVMVVVLLFLPHMASKAKKKACAVNELLRIPHEYYQPGDFILGGLTSCFLVSLDKQAFNKYLAINQLFNLL